MPKILITDPLDKKATDRLKEQAGFEVIEEYKLTPEQLLEKIKEVEAILIRSKTKVTKEVIEAGQNLKFIGRAGVGLDNVDLEAAKARDITVKNTPGASSESVAEHTLGMMFCLAKNFHPAVTGVKEGRWEKKKFKGSELGGKTLGLVGAGRIGKMVAEKAKALGMTVLAYDPFLKPEDIPEAKLTDLDEVFKESDYLSMHVPLLPETKGMINKESIGKMKDCAYIINCARGGVIDEQHLLEALNGDTLGGAALDVYENEPEVNKDLVEHPKVIGTPHIAASTGEAQARCGGELVDLVIEFFS